MTCTLLGPSRTLRNTMSLPVDRARHSLTTFGLLLAFATLLADSCLSSIRLSLPMTSLNRFIDLTKCLTALSLRTLPGIRNPWYSAP